MVEPPKKTRWTNLTFEQNNQILTYKDSSMDASQSDIRAHVLNVWDIAIGRSTVSGIVRNKETITNSPKSNTCVTDKMNF